MLRSLKMSFQVSIKTNNRRACNSLFLSLNYSNVKGRPKRLGRHACNPVRRSAMVDLPHTQGSLALAAGSPAA
jgi:hypothetical protein